MSRYTQVLRKGMFAVVTAAALGFGASQALAATPQGADSTARACSAYQDSKCRTYCQGKGYDTGWCDPTYVGGCKCLFY